jgi:hypothetical protein
MTPDFPCFNEQATSSRVCPIQEIIPNPVIATVIPIPEEGKFTKDLLESMLLVSPPGIG